MSGKAKLKAKPTEVKETIVKQKKKTNVQAKSTKGSKSSNKK